MSVRFKFFKLFPSKIMLSLRDSTLYSGGLKKIMKRRAAEANPSQPGHVRDEMSLPVQPTTTRIGPNYGGVLEENLVADQQLYSPAMCVV